jgi:hypothetical protein
MADQPVARGESFIVERRIEQGAREVGAERAADLYGADGTAGKRAAADVVDQFTVTPKAVSNRPPCLMLPASWIGIVPRERPMPKSA